ncbi:unnamed protein product [Phytophthora fragariaefolia]|uniref:Unnamed protein product n=1 Tax=Phytophthora fragariaefolia TaxID=1490495 RepID=A0A9W7CYM6_9STRA|nr:unnamed protein product [Phytophthora fragariaefolia]
MERQKDAADLARALQAALGAGADGGGLQDARQLAARLGANAARVAELVARLNDQFFRDIAPALKRAKAARAPPLDPLDRYLELGDDGGDMPQTFVDDMSGWAAPKRGWKPPRDDVRARQTAARVGEEEDELLSDDDIPSDQFHDLLIANSLRVTAMQAPDYPAMATRPAPPPPSATPAENAAATSAAAAQATTSSGKTKTSRRSRRPPPPIVTDLPPRSTSAGSTPATQTRSPEALAKRDRLGKRAASGLKAKQVLRARKFGSAREYFIRWQGVASPLWISRRKAPRQAKVLIDLFLTELRTRENEPTRLAATGESNEKKKASRTGASLRKQEATATGASAAPKTAEAEFYTVDHIVNHRTHYNKRQYLVRWESYGESDDTWENADKLRMDVPDIVDAYEEQLERDNARAEAVQSAISELNRDAAVKSKPPTKKRAVVAEDARGRGTSHSTDQAEVGHANGKRRRVATEKDGKGKGSVGGNDEGNTSEDDYQFDLEEAELEEFSDEEFADRLNT